jgi:hypothetical protein
MSTFASKGLLMKPPKSPEEDFKSVQNTIIFSM